MDKKEVVEYVNSFRKKHKRNEKGYKILHVSKKKYKNYEDGLTKEIHQKFSQENKEVYDFLIQKLGEKFSVHQLISYIDEVPLFCEKCGKNKKILSFTKGFEDCECYLENINTKEDLKNFIKEKKALDTNELFGLKKIPIILKKFPEIKDIKNKEELFLFLTETNPGKCEVCGNPTKFISFSGRKDYYDKNHIRNYNQFCCKECRQKWWSCRQIGENNTSKRMSEETKKQSHILQSISIKESIKNGKYTPIITNSWAKSKFHISFERNGKIFNKDFRSSWEVYFQLINPDLEYEKLRIPYFDTSKQKIRNYIIDFIDFNNKKVYEIKPKRCIDLRENPEKIKSLEKWCFENGFQMEIISEDYFEKNQLKTSLLQYTDKENRDKFLRIMKQYYSNFNINFDKNYED